MHIQLNGQKKEIPEHTTLEQLVEGLKFNASRIAVEINGQIKTYDASKSQRLCPGDKVEIVAFVGGG